FARVEIDFLLHGEDFLLTHNRPRAVAKLPTLRQAVEIVRSTPDGPTVLMLDAKGDAPWPKDRVTELVRLVEPVRDRIFFGSPADWNLRRLRAADSALTLAFDPQYYLTWSSKTEKLPGRVGAYGYQDTHPLALRRAGPTADYLRERFEMLLALVPDAREVHLRLGFFERMLDDGFNAAEFLHLPEPHRELVVDLRGDATRWRQAIEDRWEKHWRPLFAGVGMTSWRSWTSACRATPRGARGRNARVLAARSSGTRRSPRGAGRPRKSQPAAAPRCRRRGHRHRGTARPSPGTRAGSSSRCGRDPEADRGRVRARC